jgi:serine protease inhibitor
MELNAMNANQRSGSTRFLAGAAALCACIWLLPGGARWGWSAEAQPRPATATAHPPAGDLRAAAAGANALGMQLYKQLAHAETDLVFSPASIDTALSMCYGGAHGATARQMAQTLHFKLPDDRLHEAAGRLLPNAPDAAGASERRPYELIAANALWVDQGISLDPAFLQLCARAYHAQVNSVNFSSPASARQAINE